MANISSRIIIDSIVQQSIFTGTPPVITFDVSIPSQDAVLVVFGSFNTLTALSCLFNNVALPLLIAPVPPTGGASSAIWYLKNPPVGTYSLSLTATGASFCGLTAMVLLGVDKKVNTPQTIATQLTAGLSPVVLTIPTLPANSLVIDHLAVAYGSFPVSFTPFTDEQIQLQNESAPAATTTTQSMSYIIPAGRTPIVMGWNVSGGTSTTGNYLAIAFEPAQAPSIWFPNIDARSTLDTNQRQADTSGSPAAFTEGYKPSQFWKNSFLHTIGRLFPGFLSTLPNPRTDTFTDNFFSQSFDTAKWSNQSFSGGTVRQSGGTVILAPAPGVANNGAQLNSVNTYDLTGSYAQVQVVKTVEQGGTTFFYLQVDANNKILFQLNGRSLQAIQVVSSVQTTVGQVVFNAKAMAYWRFRESNGITYFEYSSDNIYWATLASVANPITLTALTFILEGYDFSSDTAPGAAVFANLNIIPYLWTPYSFGFYPDSLLQSVGRINPIPIIPSSDPGLTSALISYWSFEDEQGTDVRDSLNTNDLQWKGTLGDQWRSNGIINSSGNFNGVDTIASIPSASGLSTSLSLFSFGGWFYADSNQNVLFPHLINLGTDGTDDAIIYYNTSLQVYAVKFTNIGGVTFDNGIGTIPPNTWAHVIGTYDGQTVKIYVNGVLVVSTNESGTINLNSTQIVIGGASIGGANVFKGLIGQVGIWNKALISTEVKTLYNLGRGLPFPFLPNQNPVALAVQGYNPYSNYQYSNWQTSFLQTIGKIYIPPTIPTTTAETEVPTSQIIIDQIVQGQSGGGTPLNMQVPVPSQDAVLIISGGSAIATGGAWQSVKFNGIDLTKLVQAGVAGQSAEIWYLLNPPVGTYTLSITPAAATGQVYANALVVLGVDKKNTTIITASATDAAATATIAASITPNAPNALVIDAFVAIDAFANPNPDASQTQMFNPTPLNPFENVISTYKTVNSSTTMSYNLAARVNASLVVAAFKPTNAASIWFPNIDTRSINDVVTTSGLDAQQTPAFGQYGYNPATFYLNSFLHTIGRLLHPPVSVTTTQTITGVTRVQQVLTKTIAGVARIQQIVPQTITGIARITATTAQTITGVSRITATTSRTISGVTRITATTTKTVTGVSRIQKIVNQTITGISRITATTTQTITGVAKITATTTKTISGKARITATATQTITGISRIQQVVAQTITGVSRITATTTQTITGKSRITATTTRTISGVSRITVTTTKTITGVARIQQIVAQTIAGVSRITAISTQTITGVARITATTTRTITGTSRVQQVVNQTITGVSRITATTKQVITGVTRITAKTTQTVTGVSRIQQRANQTITGISRMQQVVNRTITGVTRITATTVQTITGVGRITATTTKTITGVTRIQQAVNQTITGVSRIQQVVTKTITGVSRITATTNQTITGVANIFNTTTRTITGVTRIQQVVTQVITGVASLENGIIKTVTGVSRIQQIVAQTITGVARITATTAKTITGVARVQQTTTQTITGVARIQQKVNQTITGVAHIQKIVNKTITGVAKITATTSRTITGKAQIIATTTQTITGIARIQQKVTQTITGIARVQQVLTKTITGKARLQQTVTKTIVGVSRIQQKVNQTISGISRITATTTKNITGKGNIQSTTTRSVTGVARVGQTVLQSLTGIARIQKIVAQTITGVSKITATTSKPITGKGDIAKATTQTITGIARIQHIVTQTITGISRVTAKTNKSITGVARITVTTTRSITGTARLQQKVTKTIQGITRIQHIVNQTLTGKSRVTATAPKHIPGVSRVTATVVKDVTGVASLVYQRDQDITGQSRITASTLRTIVGETRITGLTVQQITGTGRIRPKILPRPKSGSTVMTL